jgi:dTMP kinase
MTGTRLMESEDVRIELDGPVAVLIVDRPMQRNALARGTMARLAEAVRRLEQAPGVRVVVIAGGGETFIAGGDLRDLGALTTGAAGAEMASDMQAVLDALSALPVPVIAALDGSAIGGGAEVALAADVRVAAADAWLAFRQVDFAVTTGWGGAQRLAAIVGRSRALHLLWTGARVTAAEGLRAGLVDVLAPPGERALDHARHLAAGIARRPPHVVAALKRLVDAAGMPPPEHRSLERSLFAEAWGHEAHFAAVEQFLSARENRETSTTPQSGLFVVFEGIDGAGTTTQARLFCRWLRTLGQVVHPTAEPSGGPIGTLLRQALGGRVVGRDGQRLCPETIATLFAADRFDHLRTEIEPALHRGEHVVCDRYDHSSLAYQGLENDPRWVSTLNAAARRPDLVLFLDVDPAVAARRRAGRGQAPELYEVDALQVRIAAAYRDVERWRPADPIVRIDGGASVRVVQRACRTALLPLLAARGLPTGRRSPS